MGFICIMGKYANGLPTYKKPENGNHLYGPDDSLGVTILKAAMLEDTWDKFLTAYTRFSSPFNSTSWRSQPAGDSDSSGRILQASQEAARLGGRFAPVWSLSACGLMLFLLANLFQKLSEFMNLISPCNFEQGGAARCTSRPSPVCHVASDIKASDKTGTGKG